MKKLIITSAMAFFALSGAVHAAGTGTLTGSSTVSTSTNGCTWLSSDVSVSLSNAVVGAFDCATASTEQTIFIGTASALGATKSRSATCAQATGDVTSCNDSSCTSTAVAGATDGSVACTGSYDITGNSMFSASSAGGTVSASQLGLSCSTDALAACANAVASAIGALAQTSEDAAQ